VRSVGGDALATEVSMALHVSFVAGKEVEGREAERIKFLIIYMQERNVEVD
jgi:hypothetical protein